MSLLNKQNATELLYVNVLHLLSFCNHAILYSALRKYISAETKVSLALFNKLLQSPTIVLLEENPFLSTSTCYGHFWRLSPEFCEGFFNEDIKESLTV